MKKLGWLVLVLVLVGAGYFVFKWYSRSKDDPYATFIKPRIEMGAFQIKNISEEKTTADMTVLIDNAAPVGFKADSLSYQILIAGTEVMKSTYPKPVSLGANDSSTITLPVTIRNQQLMSKLKELDNSGRDSVEYTMKAQVYTQLPFLKDKPLNLEFSKELPLYRIPKVKLLDTDLNKLGLKETRILCTVEVTNPNVFAYRFRETTYRVTLDGKEFAEGSIDSTVNIPANGKSVLKLPMEVTLKEGLKAGFNMVTKPDEVDYGFTFRTKLVDKNKNNTLHNSRMVMTSKGKLQDIIEAGKAMGNKK